jgi:uncharacterized protein with HEPN domain
MPRDDAALLLDILESARNACKFVEGMSLEQFRVSHLHQHAVVRALQTAGQAARSVSAECQALHPTLPWSSMVAMRNYLVHEYFRVDVETVWKTVHEDLPTLIVKIESWVQTDPTSQGPQTD